MTTVKWKRVLCAFAALLLLSGCGSTTEELYCLPEASEDYYDLQEALSGVLSQGYGYLAPTAGVRRQPVQLVDLTGDGVMEAVAFFKNEAEGGVWTYIFSKNGDAYEVSATIACAGNSVGAVEYTDLDGSGNLSLMMTGSVSESVTQALEAYRLESGGVRQLLSASCGQYRLVDLDADGAKEIFCLTDGGAEVSAEVSYWRYDGEQMALEGSEKLSSSYSGILSVDSGKLSDGSEAMLISGADGDGPMVTDVYALVDDGFCAVIPEEEILSAEAIRGTYVYPCDINDDGYIEVAKTRQLPLYGEGSNVQWVIDWYSLGNRGDDVLVETTYHSFTENWYLSLPGSWRGQVTVRQSDLATSTTAVSCTSFYRLNQQEKPGEEIMTVYVVTGEEKREYVEAENLTSLYSDNDTIIAVQVSQDAEPWDGSISMAQVSEGFHQIRETEEG